MPYCEYCRCDHLYVCNCGHPHDYHTFRGACRVKTCKCDKYTQKAQRLEEETQDIKTMPGLVGEGV